MKITKALLGQATLAAALSMGALALTAQSASAEVVCNRHHECWHVKKHVVYPKRLGLVVRTDAWEHAHHVKGWNWRDDHEGRGYWQNGRWHSF
jgi:hypothetical protein